MHDLFERIAAEGEPAIVRLTDQRVTESVTLEFKRKRDPTNGRFDRDDKKNFGALLSGFANSAGGLGIWGVVAEKNDEEIDCATERQPINSIETFSSEAQSFCGQLLIPRHDGIELRVVHSSEFPDRGYLLVKVDRSERRPHRCEASGQRQYYKRAGDSFFEMEHYDIEDAFKRSVAANLDIVVQPDTAEIKEAGNIRTATIVFSVYIANVGDVSCRFPYVQVKHDKRSFVQKGGWLPQAQEVDGWKCFFGGSDHVIHPMQKIRVLSIQAEHQDDFFQNHPFVLAYKFQLGGVGMRGKEIDYKKTHFDMRNIFHQFRLDL